MLMLRGLVWGMPPRKIYALRSSRIILEAMVVRPAKLHVASYGAGFWPVVQITDYKPTNLPFTFSSESQLAKWIEQSKMKLNADKSSVMWFRPQSLVNAPPPDVKINDICLTPVKVQKYLGVIFDDQLRWLDHVSVICKKISFYLFWINSFRKNLPSSVIKMLIDFLVLSHINYALPAWGPMLAKGSLQRLQRLLNWGVRITAGLRKYDHISSHRARLKWLPVESQIEYRSLCAIHRQYSSHQCVPLDPPIVFGTQHSYSTRSSERFQC